MAQGADVITSNTVRDMLELADRAAVIDLFEAAMRGDVPAAFAGLRAQYDAGADPAVILSDLAAFSHVVTRLKLIPEAARDPALSEVERLRGADYARKLSVRVLSRAWQILLKGIPEVQASNRPVAAAEMVLVRLAYAADLPTPDEALRILKDGAPMPAGGTSPAGGTGPAGGAGPTGGAAASNGRPSGPGASGAMALATSQPQPRPQAASAQPTMRLRRFEDVVALAGEKREIVLKAALERDVRLVRFEEGRIELSLTETGSRTIANDLTRALQEWTGERWMVALSSEQGEPTLHEKAVAAERERKEGAANHPLVQAVLSKFPGAQIVNVVERAEKGDEDAETGILGEGDAQNAQESEPESEFDDDVF